MFDANTVLFYLEHDIITSLTFISSYETNSKYSAKVDKEEIVPKRRSTDY